MHAAIHRYAQLLLFGLWLSIQSSVKAHGLLQIFQVILTMGLQFSSTVDSSSLASQNQKELVAQTSYPETQPNDI